MLIAQSPKLLTKATMTSAMADAISETASVKARLLLGLVISISIQLLLAVVGCSSAPTPNAQPSPAVETKTAPADGKTQSNWTITEKTDPMDNIKETVLATRAIGDPGGTLLIRFKGKTLDAYVSTSEIVDDEHASVRIKFDDGSPIKQGWSRSTDYRAVFSPDPVGLISKIQSSNKFYIEYQPYQKVAETIIFNVEGLSPLLPQAEMAAHKKKLDESNAASAALRVRILPFIHRCEIKIFDGKPLPPGKWCWTDPDETDSYVTESVPWDTKEQALENALANKRLGYNFKNR